ncbi:MAG: tetratricopeptide repeat protein [Rhodothermales bacterium]|nr:tetratricopeptide repeat protein [Rhodothermales bacterium]
MHHLYQSRILPKSGLLVLALSFAFAAGAKAQGGPCSEDANTVRMNYSLYYEDYKNENWQTSLPYLRWMIECAPGFPNNSDRNYERLVEVYEGMGMGAEDPEMQRAYLDSALYVFDTAVSNLQDAGVEVSEYDWIFQKGRFLQNHAAELPDLQIEVGPTYRAAFNLEPARVQGYYINYVVLDLVQRDDKGAAVEFLDEVEEHRSDDAEIMAMVTDWRGRLFTSPEERIGFLEDQLEKKPEDADIIAELVELYMEEGYRDEVYDLAPRLMESDPSARTFRLIAKMRLEDGQADEAIDLYEQSLEMDGGPDAAKEVYYNIGIAHQQEGRLSRARTAFRQSLQADSAYGAALLAIGDLYMTAVQGCGSFEREDRAVYWLAADYFDRAASRDPAVSSQARQRLNSIRRLMPTAEDKFFKGWNAGDSYTVNYGCYAWIGETTRVR